MSNFKHIQVERAHGITTLRMLDRLLLDEARIRAVAGELAQAVKDEQGVRLIISLANVEFCSSAFWGKVLSLQRRIVGGKGRFALCSVRKEIMETLAITRLNKAWEVYLDESLAIVGVSTVACDIDCPAFGCQGVVRASLDGSMQRKLLACAACGTQWESRLESDKPRVGVTSVQVPTYEGESIRIDCDASCKRYRITFDRRCDAFACGAFDIGWQSIPAHQLVLIDLGAAPEVTHHTVAMLLDVINTHRASKSCAIRVGDEQVAALFENREMVSTDEAQCLEFLEQFKSAFEPLTTSIQLVN